MQAKNKRISSYLIKNKIFSFLLFIGIAIIIYFLSILYKNIPIVASFIIICFLYAARNYSNFIYAIYLYKMSSLPEKDLEEEAARVYFLAILSLPIIFITGILMSFLLSSPNWSAGFVQVFLLFSFFIILNEFFVIYKASKFHKDSLKKDYSRVRGQTPIGFIVFLMIENIGAIYFLSSLAFKFRFPTNILLLLSLLVFVVIWGYLFFKITKKSEDRD